MIDGIDVFILPKDGLAPKLTFEGYIEISLVFCVIWIICHIIFHLLLRIFSRVYREGEPKEACNYRMHWISFVHACTAFSLSVYCCWFTW